MLFFVERGKCARCGKAPTAAPSLVAIDAQDGCYFERQPANEAEVDDAIRAMLTSCIEAYRFAGDDPEIRRRLAEVGFGHLCVPPADQPIVLRDHVRAILPSDDARFLAELLLDGLKRVWPYGECITPTEGDGTEAALTFVHSAERDDPHRYRIELIAGGTAGAYRGGPTEWLIIAPDTKYPPMWLHELLQNMGATSLRWFSRAEWTADAPGQPLPY
jgi:hypothetical protein